MNTLRFIVFILFFYFPKAQYASEAMHIVEHEMGYGARSLSMGGAFTALGDGPSGMYWNPAGLADIKNGSVYFESYNMYHNNNTSYLGELQANPFDISRVNGLGAVLPIPTIRGSLVFGIGFNRIHHYDALMSFSGYSNFKNGLEFPIFADGELFYYTFERGVQRYEKIMSNGARDQLTFSFGIALSPNLAGGMSISRMNGLENYDFEFLQSDIADNFQEFPADFQSYELFQSLKTKTNAWKIRGGLKYIYSPFQFGLSIALPYNVNVDEVHATQERLIFDNAFKEDTIEVARYDYKVKMPSTIDFGAALVTDFNFSLSVGFRIQDWSQMQFDLIDWSAKELHLPLGASRKVAYLVAKDTEREDVAAWEATPNREAQPASLKAPSDAVDADLSVRTADKVGFLAAKSPLPPTTLGNLVKRWRTRGQSASDLTPEMRPTGSAAGNTGRAKR